MSTVKQKDASLFHCYSHGDVFRIATGKKVMDFDFTDFKSEEKIIHFMLIAIAILKKHLNLQMLLFDDVEEVQTVRIKLRIIVNLF